MVEIITSHIKHNEVVMSCMFIEDANLEYIETFDHATWISPNFGIAEPYIFEGLHTDIYKLYSVLRNFADFTMAIQSNSAKKHALLSYGNRSNKDDRVREISITNMVSCKNINKDSD